MEQPLALSAEDVLKLRARAGRSLMVTTRHPERSAEADHSGWLSVR